MILLQSISLTKVLNKDYHYHCSGPKSPVWVLIFWSWCVKIFYLICITDENLTEVNMSLSSHKDQNESKLPSVYSNAQLSNTKEQKSN